MYDELDPLQTIPGLTELLRHYAELGRPDRHVWQDRVIEHAEHDARTLTRLHGELLAAGWIEQNTGHTVKGRAGVAACYRVTPAGLRILGEFASLQD